MKFLLIGSFDKMLQAALPVLSSNGYQLVFAENKAKALAALSKGSVFSAVLINIAEDVQSLVKSIRQTGFKKAILACSVENLEKKDVQNALTAGIDEFVVFPPDAGSILNIFAKFKKTAERNQFLFQDPVMEDLVSMADRIAGSDASVLITGKSGTGKEVMARHIHAKSKRASKKFVSVNCAAIPDNLLESELFGHEKGSFTGAISTHVGKFEEASGGTLLLDEISEMDPRLQAKLLRAIQEKQIDRVGGKAPIAVDFRLISTSNRDMQEAITDGTFREDLFFRISVVELKIPPLAKRPEDLKLLALSFIEMYARLNDLPSMPTLSKKAEEWVMRYEWPGNVRQLENAMHRGVLLAENNTIEVHHIDLVQNWATEERQHAGESSLNMAATKVAANHSVKRATPH